MAPIFYKDLAHQGRVVPPYLLLFFSCYGLIPGWSTVPPQGGFLHPAVPMIFGIIPHVLYSIPSPIHSVHHSVPGTIDFINNSALFHIPYGLKKIIG